MKTIAIVACIFLFCCILPGPLRAQWVQSADLAGVNIEAMASHGSRVFAGTDGPVYVSTDNGAALDGAQRQSDNCLGIHLKRGVTVARQVPGNA